MYLQFNLVLSDVSACLVDGDYLWSQTHLNSVDDSSHLSGVTFWPVIDKCGVILKLQQVLLIIFFHKICNYAHKHTLMYLLQYVKASKTKVLPSYSDPTREPILPFNKTCCANAIIRIPFFTSSVSSIDASSKDL